MGKIKKIVWFITSFNQVGEVKHFLSEIGFELLWMCPFLELDKPASEEDWNIMVIARRGT